jgi:hypothetical protein
VVSITGVAARQVEPTVEVRLLGRSVKRLRPGQRRSKSASEKPRGDWRLSSHFDIQSWVEWLPTELGRLQLSKLDITLDYSFTNVALTGQMLAATSVLAGVLPPPVRVVNRPRWELVDRASAAVDGRLRIWLGRLVLDALRFAVKRRTVSGVNTEGRHG